MGLEIKIKSKKCWLVLPYRRLIKPVFLLFETKIRPSLYGTAANSSPLFCVLKFSTLYSEIFEFASIIFPVFFNHNKIELSEGNLSRAIWTAGSSKLCFLLIHNKEK